MKKYFFGFVVVVAFFVTSFLVLKKEKPHFCREYSLYSYGYGMANEVDKEKLYREIYNSCLDRYFKIRTRDTVDMFFSFLQR